VPPAGTWREVWETFRRVVTFFLGVFVIMDSLLEKQEATVGKLVVGLLLIGVPSVEDLARVFRRRG
jgi:hypothetical protein